jgi:GPH family glycoside/pentoside/hexuronide:cation symporter
MTGTLSRRDLLFYGFTAMPLAFAGMPLYVHAPDYYATNFGVSLSIMGIALLLLRFFDAVQDPLIGYFSDKFQKQRIFVIISSAAMLVVSFAMLFQPKQEYALFWFCIFMLLATTAFSILSINLNALGGLWSKDKSQQTRITGYREGFGLIGLLLAVLLPSIIMQIIPASSAFAWMGAILAAIMLIAIIAFYSWYKQNNTSSANISGQQSLWRILNSIPTTTRKFFAIYTVSMLASSIPALLVLFFIRDRLEAQNYTGLFLALYFLAGVTGMPVWQYLSSKYNKYSAWMIAMLLAVASFIWGCFLGAGDVWQYGLICITSGIAFSADLALPPAILADYIHEQKNEAVAASQFGLFAFLAKLALALASVIALPFLDIAGYKPGLNNDANALQALGFIYAAIPCLLKIISIFMLWRFQKFNISGENNAQNNFIRSDANV